MALPTGRVTMLFTDIEGSTRLLRALGASYADVLSGQRRIIRAAIGEHQGHEMGTEGDSFFVVFASAEEGLHAACAAQRGLAAHAWPDGAAVRIRMGLHVGEPTRHEDGYMGLDLNRSARIASTANGGQIVTSGAIESLNYQLRKVTKTRGPFPTDDAVLKIFYLAIDNIGHQRGGELGSHTQGWKQALNAFAVAYPGRVPDTLN